MQINELISKTRKDKKIKIADLANQLGITIDEIYAIEAGTIVPDIQLLKRISDILGINIKFSANVSESIISEVSKKQKQEEESPPHLIPKYKVGQMFFKKEWDRKYTPRPRMEILAISDKIDAKYEALAYFVREMGTDIGGDRFVIVTERHLDNHWTLDEPL